MLAYTEMSHFGAFLLHLLAFITKKKNSFVANTHSCVRLIVYAKKARNKTIK